MSSKAQARVLSGAALGVILGTVVHRVAIVRHGWGRGPYLAWQSRFFDRMYAEVHPFWHYFVVGLVAAGAFLGAYELLALALSALTGKESKTGGA